MTRQVLAAVFGSEGQEMRKKITETHSKKQDICAKCACCYQSVFVAYARAPGGGGSSPCFKHYGDAGKKCPWTTDKPDDPRAIGAQQYEGRQKPERHDKLTSMIQDALMVDNRVEQVKVERYHYSKHHDHDRGRFPDVFARLKDVRELAFEMQLSGTIMTEIAGRYAYCLSEDVGLVWLFDGTHGDYSKQSFKEFIQDHS